MGSFHLLFESAVYRTLKTYTIFLTFLNVPYFLQGLMAKSKIILDAICSGSSLMFSVQVNLLKWFVDWIGTLLGKRGLFNVLESFLANLTSTDIAAITVLVLSVLLAIVILHFGIKVLGRFFPVVANLQAHHHSSSWGVLYLVVLVVYIVIAVTA
ncbi:hypothetical protein EPO05_03710 [Patescibacteria group bacterium]|nr:MAG: hypothetical protein EPO05_03710 [Patescibacteria group bacterium]